MGRALERGEFVPYFQPLVDLRSGEIHGFEILARWLRPNLGLISPGAFVPLLEQYRLMNHLTAALLIPAFAAARALPSGFGFSVNLSPTQLHDPCLPRLLQVMADEAEFDLKRLTVELTETALVDNLERAGTVAEALKGTGISLSLDDFGTGYSSLLHLQSLPFDELKVDASFVRSMTQSRQSRKITAAVISLGLSLGLQTVAEGIEDQNQANLLVWQGCHLGQGYLYGQAVPANKLENLLAQPKLSTGVTEVPSLMGGSFVSLDARPTERLSQLRAVYDGAPVALGFIDTQLRHVNLNQRMAQLNGKTVEEHLGRKVSEVVDPRIYATFEPYLLRALEGESLSNIELTSPPIPGESPKTMMVSYQPVRDEAGEVLGVCVSIADITALKQKDQALTCSEARLRAVFEAAPVGIGLIEASTGRILKANPRIEQITGFRLTPGMIWSSKGLRVFDTKGDLIPESRMPLARALHSGEATDSEEMLLRRSDGSSVWISITVAPVHLNNGSQEGVVVIVQDIDSTRREHQKLLDLTRMLESVASVEVPTSTERSPWLALVE